MSLVCTGENGHGLCMNSSVQLTAEGLQLDSFCRDSTHPVVLHAASDVHRATAQQSTGSMFAVELQV